MRYVTLCNVIKKIKKTFCVCDIRILEHLHKGHNGNLPVYETHGLICENSTQSME